MIDEKVIKKLSKKDCIELILKIQDKLPLSLVNQSKAQKQLKRIAFWREYKTLIIIITSYLLVCFALGCFLVHNEEFSSFQDDVLSIFSEDTNTGYDNISDNTTTIIIQNISFLEILYRGAFSLGIGIIVLLFSFCCAFIGYILDDDLHKSDYGCFLGMILIIICWGCPIFYVFLLCKLFFATL